MHVLMAWELGDGGGHLDRLRNVATALHAAGHQVTLICPQSERAVRWGFGRETDFMLHEAPRPRVTNRSVSVRTWADLVWQNAWRDNLPAYLTAWETQIARLKPDVLVTDYAPTADVAARRLGLPTVTVSDGFTRPPDTSPLPDLRRLVGLADSPHTPADACVGEEAMLAAINPLLDTPLPWIGAIYRDVPDVRCTFAELDHLGPQARKVYFGPLRAGEFDAPRWPEAGEGAWRVFVYVRDFPALPALLALLGVSGMSVAAYLDGAAVSRVPDNIAIHRRPIDVQAVARHADFAVIHTGVGTTQHMLAGGVPLLALPTHLEQMLLARRVQAIGAGVLAGIDHPESIRDGIRRLLLDDSFSQAARRFANHHASYDPGRALESAVKAVENA